MVAGRRLWSEDEQQAADHQPGGGGDLGVEAVEQDGARAGEARAELADVETSRKVYEEDDRETDEPKPEDDAPETLLAPHGRRADFRRYASCFGPSAGGGAQSGEGEEGG